MSCEIDRHLGRALQFRRQRLGLSVRSLSRRTGISEANLCELEAGRAAFERKTLLSLAAGLDIPVFALLDTDEHESQHVFNNANQLVAIFVDLLARDYRQLERNPVFKALNRIL